MATSSNFFQLFCPSDLYLQSSIFIEYVYSTNMFVKHSIALYTQTTHTHTQYSHKCTHTLNTHIHTHAHTYMHTHTYTRTHAHTYTHTHLLEVFFRLWVMIVWPQNMKSLVPYLSVLPIGGCILHTSSTSVLSITGLGCCHGYL